MVRLVTIHPTPHKSGISVDVSVHHLGHLADVADVDDLDDLDDLQ